MPIRAPHKATSYVTAVRDLARDVQKLHPEAGPERCPPRPAPLGRPAAVQRSPLPWVQTPGRGPQTGARPVWPSRRRAGGETEPGTGALWVPVQHPGAPPACGLSNSNSLSTVPGPDVRDRGRAPAEALADCVSSPPAPGGSRRPPARGLITPVPAATCTWLLPASPSLPGTLVIKLTLPHPESLALPFPTEPVSPRPRPQAPGAPLWGPTAVHPARARTWVLAHSWAWCTAGDQCAR